MVEGPGGGYTTVGYLGKQCALCKSGIDYESRLRIICCSGFGWDRRGICHGRVSGTQDCAENMQVSGVGALCESDGVMMRGSICDLLGHEHRVARFLISQTPQSHTSHCLLVLSLSFKINIDLSAIVGGDLFNGRGYDGERVRLSLQVPAPRARYL